MQSMMTYFMCGHAFNRKAQLESHPCVINRNTNRAKSHSEIQWLDSVGWLILYCHHMHVLYA